MTGFPSFSLSPDQAAADALLTSLREQAAVHEVELSTGLRVWVITRYAQAKAALMDPRLRKDPRTLSDRTKLFDGRRHPEDSFAVLGRHVLNTDGVDHRRLRRLLNEFLSPTQVHERRPRIANMVDRQLDVLGRAPQPDLVADFANPVLITMVGSILGIKPALLGRLFAAVRVVMSDRDPESAEVRNAAELQRELIITAIEQRDEFAGDTLLKSALGRYHRENQLSLAEITTMVAFTVFASTTTSATLLTIGALTLCSRPDLLASLSSGLDEKRSGLIEEILRLHPPAPCATWRFAAEPIELGNATIPKDATVLVVLASANRDAQVFPHGQRLDPRRIGQPNHLSFGHGPHFCVGAPLARAVADIGLVRLFSRFPKLQPTTPLHAMRWSTNLGDRHLVSAPIDLGRE